MLSDEEGELIEESKEESKSDFNPFQPRVYKKGDRENEVIEEESLMKTNITYEIPIP